MKTKVIKYLLLVLCVTFVITGCATPKIESTSYTKILPPDQEDDIGGSFLESGDIRTIAYNMTTSLLSSRPVTGKNGIVRIAIAPIRNSTRFIIDKDIFLKRLRIELNKVANSQIRFFAQGMGQDLRSEILQEQDKELWDSVINEISSYIVKSEVVTNTTMPLRVAVIPVKNTNIADINADSFTALIRSKIAEKAGGKVNFLSREENGKIIDQILAESDLRNLGLIESARNKSIAGVDYFLGGEFIAKSLSVESAQIIKQMNVGISKDDPGTVEYSNSNTLKHPNTETYLNVMLIDAQTGTIPVEKMLRIEKEMKSGLSKADFVLTGELSALSKGAAGGDRSDYIIVSFQLLDPQSNEVVWEDSYETKKVTNKGVLYK